MDRWANDINYCASCALCISWCHPIYHLERWLACCRLNSAQIVWWNYNPCNDWLSTFKFVHSFCWARFDSTICKGNFRATSCRSDTLKNLEVISVIWWKVSWDIYKTPKIINLRFVNFLSCGSMRLQKYWIESIVKIPVEVESEPLNRYRESVQNHNSCSSYFSHRSEKRRLPWQLYHVVLWVWNTLTICNVVTLHVKNVSSMFIRLCWNRDKPYQKHSLSN